MATFSNLTLSNGATGYTLGVNSGSLNPTTSDAVTVTQAPTITSYGTTTFTEGVSEFLRDHRQRSPWHRRFPRVTATCFRSGVTFSPASGISERHSYPSGSYTLHFTAGNGVGSNAAQTFTLNICDVHLALR